MSERSAASTDIAGLLAQWSHGDRHALDQVLPLVYFELRKIASRQLGRERHGHNLDPSDLVHDLFVQLVDQQHASWHSRAQFFATAARMMRRILVDHARARHAAKRGGSAVAVSLTVLAAEPALRTTAMSDVLIVDQALERLAEHDINLARIFELRFFTGLSVEEVAHVTGVSPRTVKREWRVAKAWLFREFGRPALPDA